MTAAKTPTLDPSLLSLFAVDDLRATLRLGVRLLSLSVSIPMPSHTTTAAMVDHDLDPGGMTSALQASRSAMHVGRRNPRPRQQQHVPVVPFAQTGTRPPSDRSRNTYHVLSFTAGLTEKSHRTATVL